VVDISRKKRKTKKKKNITVMDIRAISIILEYSSSGVCTPCRLVNIYLPTFRIIVVPVPSYLLDCCILKSKEQLSFETSATVYHKLSVCSDVAVRN